MQAFGTILGMEILWSSTLPLAESCTDSSKMFLLVRLILTEGVASFFSFFLERQDNWLRLSKYAPPCEELQLVVLFMLTAYKDTACIPLIRFLLCAKLPNNHFSGERLALPDQNSLIIKWKRINGGARQIAARFFLQRFQSLEKGITLVWRFRRTFQIWFGCIIRSRNWWMAQKLAVKRSSVRWLGSTKSEEN